MATFYNQASLSYNGFVTNSNVTSGEILDSAGLEKSAISQFYRRGSTVSFVASISNSGVSALTDITFTDNLGAFTVGTETVYPLTYVDGSVRYYVNGEEEPAPTVNPGPPLTISPITVQPGANILIIYEAVANEFAPLEEGSTITNTASITGSCITESTTSSATVPVKEEIILTIAKALCPETVVGCDELTYTFIIQNGGNIAAGEDANIVIRDVFNPILTDIVVKLNSAEVPATFYTYDTATGVFETVAGEITVPAATFTQDPITGVVTLTPGVTVLTVNGRTK